MGYSTMIFDIDGTLTDSAAIILHALRQAVLETTGKDYDEKELSFALGVPSQLAIKHLTGEKWKEAVSIGQAYYVEGLKNIRLFDGIEDTIKNLHKKGTQLGIVTSKTRAEFNRSFFNYPIHPYFTHIICRDDTPYHKPDPHPLLACTELFHVTPSSVLYVGDTLADSSCAQNAGIDFALAGWGCTDHTDIPAEIVLQFPKDLLELAAN